MTLFNPLKSSNLTQAGGDVLIPIPTRDLVWLQIDAECSATPTAGTLAVLFKTPGMATAKALLDASGNPITIDLKKPYPAYLSSLCIDALVLRPTSFDADKTFNVVVTFKGA